MNPKLLTEIERPEAVLAELQEGCEFRLTGIGPSGLGLPYTMVRGHPANGAIVLLHSLTVRHGKKEKVGPSK